MMIKPRSLVSHSTKWHVFLL